MSWLNCLLVYSVIGVLVLLVIPAINGFLKKQKGKESESATFRSFLESKPTTLGDKFLEWFLAPLVAISLFILGWPFLIYLAFKEHLSPTQPYVEKVFLVEKGHLGNPVDVSEVEAKQMVFDPLGAVPDLPFGHLNSAWGEFNDQMEDGDRLWTFSAEWESDWGRAELRDGYVIVKPDASVGAFFMTRWIMLDKPKIQPKEKRSWDWLRRAAD